LTLKCEARARKIGALVCDMVPFLLGANGKWTIVHTLYVVRTVKFIAAKYLSQF